MVVGWFELDLLYVLLLVKLVDILIRLAYIWIRYHLIFTVGPENGGTVSSEKSKADIFLWAFIVIE